ncbi:MAG: hypothetical protein VYE77_11950 [Planctomycetota bacterium]|nr:hypothetical protein [Planctomycetota bacterium]
MDTNPATARSVDHVHTNAPANARLAKGAVLGLIWSLAGVLVGTTAWIALGPEPVTAPPSLGDQIFQALLWLSLAGVLGGPVVSSMACSRIRHSGGALRGLGMATVGVLLVPVAFLASLVFVALLALIQSLTDNRELAQALSLVAGCLVLIVSAVVLARAARRAR